MWCTHELGHVEISKPIRTHGIRTQMVLSEKPIKHIELTRLEYLKVRQSLIDEHGPVMNISWVMRRKCGFVLRKHEEYLHDIDWQKTIKYFVDFFDEASKTYFILKYA